LGLPFAEDVVGETKEETGFTDGGVSDEEELEKEIVILVHQVQYQIII
jgi:hypothetical protein